MTGLPKTVLVTSSETEEALKEISGSDCRSCYFCIGTDATGTIRRCSGQRDTSYRRWLYVKRIGRVD